MNGDFEVRGYREGDEHAILETFNRVFAGIDPGFVPRTLETWRWAYLENPAGSRISLAVARDGRVVAQYAGLGQRVQIGVRRAFFSQSVDSFADPTFARGLARSRAFVAAGEAYAARFGGADALRDAVMWGLPVPAAARIGRAALGYEPVRTLAKLVAPLDVLGQPSAVAVEELESAPDEVERLFSRRASSLGYVAVRDRQHYHWRYTRHPTNRYRLAVARRDGELAGLAVYGAGTFDLERSGLIADWIVPVEDRDAAKSLLAWLVRAARADGERQLVALFPDTSSEWLAFQSAGFRVRPTRLVVVARSYVRSIAIEDLRRRWWWTLGDTDLI